MPETRYKTRYEKTRVLSARALQIAQGSPPMLKVPKNMSEPLDIARVEWKHGLIPIDIKRHEKEEKQ